MIKVPGTPAGIEAFRELIASGISVNVTLLFAVGAHRKVIEAYLDGLEQRVAAGEDVTRIASVASFFVSRVDTTIDAQLERMITDGRIDAVRGRALMGKAAIANARLAYRLARTSFSGPRWARLAERGARVQRPLWASTSTKNPDYRDVVYVEQLIGPDTVNTMPVATLQAFRDHGEAARTVDANVDDAVASLADLESVGISLAAVTDRLLVDGLASFQASFDSLLAGLDRKSRALGRELVAAR
jgi:transaldolase